MYLLDTNVISELRRPRPHGAVLAWLRGLPDHQIHLSAVSIFDLQAGVEATRSQNPAKADEIEAWIEGVVAGYAVLPVDGAAFRLAAKLLHRRPAELFEDALIAATALVHNLTVATRNTRDFAPFGVPTLNPFKR